MFEFTVGLLSAIYWLVRRRLNSVVFGTVLCRVVTNGDLSFFFCRELPQSTAPPPASRFVGKSTYNLHA
jgi:hypothetical protein